MDPQDLQDIEDDTPEELICACCGDPCDEVDDDGFGPCCEDVKSESAEHGFY